MKIDTIGCVIPTDEINGSTPEQLLQKIKEFTENMRVNLTGDDIPFSGQKEMETLKLVSSINKFILSSNKKINILEERIGSLKILLKTNPERGYQKNINEATDQISVLKNVVKRLKNLKVSNVISTVDEQYNYLFNEYIKLKWITTSVKKLHHLFK